MIGLNRQGIFMRKYAYNTTRGKLLTPDSALLLTPIHKKPVYCQNAFAPSQSPPLFLRSEKTAHRRSFLIGGSRLRRIIPPAANAVHSTPRY